MRDMTDIIGMTNYVTKRCFDKILIYIDTDAPKLSPFEEVFSLMLHHINFLKHVYGKNVIYNVGVYFQNSTQLPDDIIPSLKEAMHGKTPVG